MNCKKLWKTALCFSLAAFLIFPAASLTAAKSGAAAAADRSDVLIKYSQMAAKYLADCDGLAEQARPSGERLKRCLTISKELRDRFAEFIATLDTLVRNFKRGKKWTPELDEQFSKEAAKGGLDAETVNLVRQSGGFRAFYEQSLNDLKAASGDLDREIKTLETKLQKNSSAQSSPFQTVSFEPAAEYNRAGKLKLFLKVAKAIADAATYVCTFTKFCE